MRYTRDQVREIVAKAVEKCEARHRSSAAVAFLSGSGFVLLTLTVALVVLNEFVTLSLSWK